MHPHNQRLCLWTTASSTVQARGLPCVEAATKGMFQIFGPVVRDEFMPDCKFCNDKICEQIVTKCIVQNEMVQTPGMTCDQFIKMTASSKTVSQFFNSQQHHIESKMRSNCTGEKRQMHVDETDGKRVHSHCSHDCPTEQKEKGSTVLGWFLGVLRMTPNGKRSRCHTSIMKNLDPKEQQSLNILSKKFLARVQPKQTCFRLFQGHHPISKWFTASDKAFALIILDNELHHVCDQKIEMKKVQDAGRVTSGWERNT